MKENLLIIGAGGHGRSVAEAADLSNEWGEIAFMDDDWADISALQHRQVWGPNESLLEHFPCAIVAIGNNQVRYEKQEIAESQGYRMVSVIHPKACVSPSAELGAGCAVMAGAVVGAHAVLGKGVIVNANATADHDVSMGDYAHIGVGCSLAGGVSLERFVWLQAGVAVGYHVIVAANEMVAPGVALVKQ